MKDYPTYSKKRVNRLIRKKVNKADSSSKKLAIAWILLILVALFFVQQRINYIRTEKNIRRLMLDERQVRASIQPLKLEERFLTQLSKVEKTATESLVLREPAKWQIFPINAGKPKVDTTKTPPEDK